MTRILHFNSYISSSRGKYTLGQNVKVGHNCRTTLIFIEEVSTTETVNLFKWTQTRFASKLTMVQAKLNTVHSIFAAF